MTDCRHAARVGDVLLPCTVVGVHSTFTHSVPAVGGRDEHRHAPRTEFRSVSWVDGDVWDVVQPDPEPTVRERAVEVLRAFKGSIGLDTLGHPSSHLGPLSEHTAGRLADALVEAGLLSEPCRHEPIESRGWCPADGRVVAERTALPHGDCGSIHRPLFVEQEGGP